jgi:5-methylcytosine-specific restriction endonuclease McrA
MLSTLSIMYKYITPELLERISNRSKKEVDSIVAGINPGLLTKDTSRPVVVERLVAQPRTTKQQTINCKEFYRRSGGKLFASVEKSTCEIEPQVVRQKVKMHDVRCFVDDDVMKQVERCKQLLSSKYPNGLTYSELLKELATEWLSRHDPVEKSERRKARKKRLNRALKSKPEHTRHIPASVRDAVYKRDAGRCAFVGSNGKRCNSQWDLEIHHDGTPFGRGGRHAINYLKLLCSVHNKLEAEREYGKAVVRKHYVKEARVGYVATNRVILSPERGNISHRKATDQVGLRYII